MKVLVARELKSSMLSYEARTLTLYLTPTLTVNLEAVLEGYERRGRFR